MAFKSFLEVKGVPTHVACWGRWVEEEHPDEVIICITGNPGVAGYYYPYLEKIHHITNIPTWVIGHGGHEEPVTSNNSTFLKNIGAIKGRETIFNLQGQYDQKVEFIQKYTKPTTKIHLLGHSVGGWIALEMFKDDRIKDRITSTQLLFPTIQKIANTPNGFWVNSILRRITPLILALLWILNNIIPTFIFSTVVGWYMHLKGYPAQFTDVSVKYLSGSVINKVLFMAYDEMDRIKDLDVVTLNENKDKIKIVYNRKDGWAPGYLFEDFPTLMPSMFIKEVPYCHAFVLKDYDKMATLTARLIVN